MSQLVEDMLSLLNMWSANSDKNAGGGAVLKVANEHAVNEMLRFLDEMPGGFFIYRADETEQLLYANKAVLRIFGCDTMEQFLSITDGKFKGLVYHEDLDAVENSIRDQIEHSVYDLDYVEYRIVCRDGSLRWIEDYGHYIRSETAGGIFYVFIGDATEKRRRRLIEQNALLKEKQESEQKLRSLIKEYDKELLLINQEHLRRLEVIEGLSANYESILYADMDTDKIIPYRLSERTKHQFKKNYQTRSFEWYIDDYVKVWVHPEDKENVRMFTNPDYIRSKLKEDKTYYINYRVIKDGELQYLQLRVVNVGRSDIISQIVMGYRKVDEEILREMEQKKILESALSNAKMANMAKNAFLSNMSHDMRTPLNAIFGFTSLAKNHVDNSDAVNGYLQKIEASGKQLLDLIDKVLEISWVESNDIYLTESECSLNDIMREVYNETLPQAVEKNIDFSINGDIPDDSAIYSDRDKLKQLMLYITNNAVKYTQSGGRVELSFTETERLPNSYAAYKFTVKDTGIGISKEFMEHIFEPFEREKNTTFSGVFGTGLGLTIARNIVEIMGGTIDVESEVGKGSTFTVSLKLRVQEKPAVTETVSPENAMATLLNSKILLVEDNEINLEIETEILRELGFTIDTAENGQIAVEMIKKSEKGEYTLVLMDIQMPVMDGRRAAEEIRRLERPEHSGIPIIALSANALSSDKQLSIESGMNAHLPKPIDIPLLLETMTKVIQI